MPPPLPQPLSSALARPCSFLSSATNTLSRAAGRDPLSSPGKAARTLTRHFSRSCACLYQSSSGMSAAFKHRAAHVFHVRRCACLGPSPAIHPNAARFCNRLAGIRARCPSQQRVRRMILSAAVSHPTTARSIASETPWKIISQRFRPMTLRSMPLRTRFIFVSSLSPHGRDAAKHPMASSTMTFTSVRRLHQSSPISSKAGLRCRPATFFTAAVALPTRCTVSFSVPPLSCFHAPTYFTTAFSVLHLTSCDRLPTSSLSSFLSFVRSSQSAMVAFRIAPASRLSSCSPHSAVSSASSMSPMTSSRMFFCKLARLSPVSFLNFPSSRLRHPLTEPLPKTTPRLHRDTL